MRGVRRGDRLITAVGSVPSRRVPSRRAPLVPRSRTRPVHVLVTLYGLNPLSPPLIRSRQVGTFWALVSLCLLSRRRREQLPMPSVCVCVSQQQQQQQRM